MDARRALDHIIDSGLAVYAIKVEQMVVIEKAEALACHFLRGSLELVDGRFIELCV